VPCCQEAIAANRRIGNARGRAVNRNNLGAALREAGNPDGVTSAWRHAWPRYQGEEVSTGSRNASSRAAASSTSSR
jgi:hypothetical protein